MLTCDVCASESNEIQSSPALRRPPISPYSRIALRSSCARASARGAASRVLGGLARGGPGLV